MPIAALVLAFSSVQPAPAGRAHPQEPAAHEEDKRVERLALPRGKDKPPLFMEWTLASSDPGTPTLVLLHASRSSKGEYRPIVPRLKGLGYNCLAVDLIHGTECRGVKNLTARAARDAGRNTDYLDALVDIVDALQWARDNHAKGGLVLWGSSYSAGLAIHLAGERTDLVDGVLAFSPGEYFGSVGKGPTWIQESAKKVTCPVFLASARNEEVESKAIFEALASGDKTRFLPQGPGTHGSKALWEESAGNAEYWAAVEVFLKRAFPAVAPAGR